MKTWILIADQARARLFEACAADGGMHELAGLAHPEGRQKPHETGDERKTRVQESANAARHAAEPHTDPRDKVALEFAHGLAQLLESGRVEHDYERLILVAPPRFLGQLRASLGEQVARRVVASVDKNIAGAGIDAIRAELGGLL